MLPDDVATWRQRLTTGLAGTVVEIGAGTGRNLGLLDPSVRWVGVEPDRRRAALLRHAARDRFRDATVLRCGAEALPLPDGTADAVLSTFALCSVRDQPRVLAEVRRVLRPGGGLRLLEHVAAPRGTWTRLAQRAVAPVSVLVDHGCHPARDTGAALAAAGFTADGLHRFRSPGPLGTWVDHVAGTAGAV
ncbi:class I SAM-dependent methyltransferase [Phycicoccus sonneratiae]|uniref:Class I SAM-dependent methyltransferase n=1 Tax=Phycicoccus sonneratiae TaxID=2807628 RepID=A0ABS2CSS8_9MICO|nr:class I SAM-dependent methyltransferase [Phycicoccus sonneraticus]MBM6402221.1 class I SAM-dependent methyltransferase [Phycicoccus sonneraticus]